MSTDWCLRSIVEPIFPGYIRWNDKRTDDVVVVCQILEPNHPFLEGVQSEIRQAKWQKASPKAAKADEFKWWLENRSFPIQILNHNAVHVLIASWEIKQKWGEAPVLVYFDYGQMGGRVVHMISHTHLQKGEPHKALEYYRRCLDICLEIGYKQGSIYGYCGLGEANLELGNIQVAVEHIENAVDVSVEVGARKEEATGYKVLGMAYREAGKLDKAIDEFERANNILNEIGDSKEIAKVFYEYGLLCKTRGQHAKAKEHLEKALSEFEHMGMKLWVERCEKALEELDQ